MANTYLTPNMNLKIPVPGSDPGPDWANNLNASLTIIDAHTHLNGTGVPITPAAININSPLQMNGFTLSSAGSVLFATQTSPPANLNLYVDSPDLFFVDGNGNNVQLTSGGSVNATSSGISSGSATASFVGGALVVNSATNTPGNIQGGSLLIGNNVASSNFVTLSAVGSLASSYPLVLPTIPSQPTLLTIDTSGNITAPINPSISGNFTLGGTINVTGNSTFVNATFNGGVGFNNIVIFADPITLTGGISGGASVLSGDLVVSTGNIDVPDGNVVLSTGVLESVGLSSTGPTTVHGLNVVVSNTNAAAGLCIVRGYVSSSGVKLSGEGFTVNHVTTGEYTLTFTTPFADIPAVTVTGIGSDVFANIFSGATISASTVTVVTGTVSSGSDQAFMFTAIGQV